MSRWGKRQLQELFYYLKLTRRLEEEIASLQREGKVPGPFYLGAGREAVSVGAAYPLRSGDFFASSLPSVGSMLVRGVRPKEIVAHFMGKEPGPTRGRSGSTQLGDLDRGMISPAGHLATHVSVMAGVAFGAKYTGNDIVALAVVGERAMATGDFHEGLNFAAVRQLPLVVVVENGPYASSVSSFAENSYLYERARGYGLPSLPVDGVDILQVLQVVEAALERARSGKGPTLVEARTARSDSYGLEANSVPVPIQGEEASLEGRGDRMARKAEATSESERTMSDQQTRVLNDPVQQFESFLVDHRLLEPVERGLALDRIEKVLADQIQQAEDAPFPDADTQTSGVFRDETAG